MRVILLILTLSMIMIHAPDLIKRKCWKDFAVFLLFVLAGLVLGVILIFRLPFPNPIKIIETLYAPITQAFFGKK